ncbi:MAG: glutaredoxin family protein [Planctomycetaceae bacterium]|nr:glutaredoxin family protein [Planctomycetaceae bacterium]
MFFGGITLLLFAFLVRAPGVSLQLPGIWYRNESLWPFVGIAISVVGYFLIQKTSTIPPAWEPSLPGQRFQRVVVYTRESCHLCDVAKDTMHRFERWLPPIEEIDISESEELTDKYAESIPVIEIDGRERFRGVVSEVLLKRLIEATPPNRKPQKPI